MSNFCDDEDLTWDEANEAMSNRHYITHKHFDSSISLCRSLNDGRVYYCIKGEYSWNCTWYDNCNGVWAYGWRIVS